MHRITRALDNVLNNILITLMIALVAAVSWQVISRYVFASPSSWTEEAARFLMIWVGLLGAAYAFRTGVHLGFDLLPQKLSGQSAKTLKLLTLVAVILFSLTVLIIGGSNLVVLTWELKQHSAVLGLPIAWVYAVIPAAGTLICVYAIAAATDEGKAELDHFTDSGA
ncbi:MAG: TRAP transporter small permease [Woeseiaceae bacterium]|nr:TRAP transporter small permease [Woeseiaceae bacterium]